MYPKDDDWGDYEHERRKQARLDKKWDEEAHERHVRVITNTCENASERKEREYLLRWLVRGHP